MQIKKSELLKALDIVKPGLASKDIIEQATSFAFSEDHVITFNNEICISYALEGLNITGAVKAEEFYKLLNKLKSDDLELVVEKNELLIHAGRAKAGLTFHADIKLPIQEIYSAKITKFKSLPNNFAEACLFAASACSSDLTKPILNCIHITTGFIEGSDGFRLAQHDCETDFETIIPAKSIRVVANMNPVKYCLTNGWCHFITESGAMISCRTLYADEYPMTGNITKYVNGEKIALPKSTTDVIERAKVFKSSTQFINVTLATNRIRIKSQSETGWYEEELNMLYDGKPLDFIISSYLLLDILTKTNVCIVTDRLLRFEGQNWIYLACLNI